MKTVEERKDDFIRRAKEVHKGENLDYSQVFYVDNRTPVKIIDKTLGEFWQTPSNHLRGSSHPDRRGSKISESKKMSQEEVISRFMEVHAGENLDYSQVEYNGMHVKVKIISHELRPDGTEYGEFWQEPAVHLKGCTHPDISRDRQIERQTSNTEEFIRKAKYIHSTKNYDYCRVNYVNNRTKVEIICNKIGSNGKPHGIFSISPDNFLRGEGCPKCGNHISTGEDYIYNELCSYFNKGEIIRNDRSLLDGSELDLYIPSKGVAIEFNGLRWHSEKFGKDKYYHLKKTLLCKEKGITLLHIFEDEYISRKEIVLSKIRNILGLNTGLERIGARKCTIKEIDYKSASVFLENNHIQGKCKASVYLGLYRNEKLVSVMLFTHEKGGKWILVRFASDIHYIVQGAASKLFSYFISKYEFTEIRTFLDRRFENNAEDNVYIKLGFGIDSYLKPDYYYTNGHGIRRHKFGFRKKILSRKYGFPLTMTESEMVSQLGYYKIWNCGLIAYVFNC